MLEKGLLQPGDLDDFNLGHRLEPLDHVTFIRDRIDQMEGVHGHHPDLWEPTDEVFDERAVVGTDHVQDRQVDEVLGIEGVENVNGIRDGEIPEDEGGKAREVNGREIDIDNVLKNPLGTCCVQRELA